MTVARPPADGAVAREAPADQSAVRRGNLGRVLRLLRDEGPRSRARIAEETGLNKATVSSLVAELAERGLITDGDVDRAGSVGRPGLLVQLDGRAVCAIGVELNVDFVAILVLDLRGDVLLQHRMALDVPALGAEGTLDEVARLVQRARAATAPTWSPSLKRARSIADSASAFQRRSVLTWRPRQPTTGTS